jgi:catechol 2,3-dioxygenase-like lactoylglutathione lyase family enzyme
MELRNSAPPIRGVLETAIYSDDLAAAHRFYGGVLGLDRVLDTQRMVTYAVAPGQVLLVFRRGMTREDSGTAGGVVPGHHSEGPAHFAFAIAAEAYDAWKAYLGNSGIPLRSEVLWPKGGKSLYFDDPDGNVVEMATPGLWLND